MLNKFRQTGPPHTHVHHEDSEGRAPVWITRPGRVEDARTGGPREARESHIIGSLRRQEGGWEADEQLQDYLTTIRKTPPPTSWPDLEEAFITIDGSVTSAWRRSQEE